jgi:hypothetical protein
MSTPIRPEPDPFSLALGRIEGRLDGIEKRLDGMDKRFDSIDHRFDRLEAHVHRLIGGVYLLSVLGFTVLGWLVTRR